MFEQYFDAKKPTKRKKVLDQLEAAPGEEEALAQIQKLFEIRYKPNRKGEFDDTFVGALMNLRLIADRRPGKMAEKRTTAEVKETVESLCLYRTDEFSQDILYEEMCQLMSLYAALCQNDSHYRSVILGFGRINDSKTASKITKDLDLVWDVIDRFVGQDEYTIILKRAINKVKGNLEAVVTKVEDEDDDL